MHENTAFLLSLPPVAKALEELLHKCWYADGVVVVSLEAPAIQTPLRREFETRLGADFRCVSLTAGLLTTPQSLLEELVEAVALSQADGAGMEDLIDTIRLAAGDSFRQEKELVIQVENAHDLNAETLAVLAELVGQGDSPEVTPHVVLWSDTNLSSRMAPVCSRGKVPLSHVLVPAFTPGDIRVYLEHCLRAEGFEGKFPFSSEQVEAICREARGSPAEISHLTERELTGRAEGKKQGRGMLSGIPMPVGFLRKPPAWLELVPKVHVIAAALLLFTLVLIFGKTGTQDDTSESTSPVAPAPAGIEGGESQLEEELEVTGRPPAPEQQDAASLETGRPEVVSEPEPEVVLEREPEVAPEPEREEVAQPEIAGASPLAPENPAEPEETVSSDSGGPQEAASSDAGGPQFTLRENHAALQALPGEHFVIQMMGSFSPQSAVDFMSANAAPSGQGAFYYFRTRYQGRPWYVVVLGAFASRAEAAEALRGLPAAMKSASPWVRSVTEVQNAIEPE